MSTSHFSRTENLPVLLGMPTFQSFPKWQEALGAPAVSINASSLPRAGHPCKLPRKRPTPQRGHLKPSSGAASHTAQVSTPPTHTCYRRRGVKSPQHLAREPAAAAGRRERGEGIGGGPVTPPRPARPPPLACLSPCSPPPGCSRRGRTGPRPPRGAAHAHRRGPPHLRRRHKVPASGVRGEPGCSSARPGAAPPPCPAPRTPAPPRAGAAQLRGWGEGGRSSPRRPHPRALVLLLGRRRLLSRTAR
jgi:hypothetical protein